MDMIYIYIYGYFFNMDMVSRYDPIFPNYDLPYYLYPHHELFPTQHRQPLILHKSQTAEGSRDAAGSCGRR